MNKTILRNIHLVNWYGFSNRTIPVSENLTLISGENECGKSTILDAVKYAYTGDTQFNKATSGYNTGVGKRNLVSYTRCLVDASSGIYARPADKIPVVYTHIALEYFDQINESSFVLGVVIETAVTDIRGTYWYAMDGKTIADISFVYEDGSLIKPYDASGFQKKYGIQMKNKKDGITLFMQMIGLKLPYQEVPKYQRKLRNIMAYNPAAKIQEFIKESVLEEHDVNFDKLKEAKKNIEQIKSFLSRQKETYKVPYEVHPEDRPRQCVFCGTSNDLNFLPLDRTGNRRFAPVMTDMSKAEVHILDNEAESKAYIEQAWAEAMVLYRQGNVFLGFTKEIEEEAKRLQKEFMPEDTNAGIIQEFLDDYDDDYVCTRILFDDALHRTGEMKQWEGKEIANIMNNAIVGWKPHGTHRFGKEYGIQRSWKRMEDSVKKDKDGFIEVPEQLEIPFE